MRCAEVRDWLRCDLDGAAEPSGDVAAHLDGCAACRGVAEDLKALGADARRALPPPDVPAGFTSRVMEAVDGAPADAVLADAVRRRWTRWWPVLVPLLIAAFLLPRGEDRGNGGTDGDVSGCGAGAGAPAPAPPEEATPPPLRADPEWAELLRRAEAGDAAARARLERMRARIDDALETTNPKRRER